MGRQLDKAIPHFKNAAAEYSEALQQDPPPRTMRFTSTLIKAGISFFYAGDYQQCIKAMGMAVKQNKKMWESPLFSSLAQAKLGNKEATFKSLQAFQDAQPSQRLISKAISAQLPGMQNGAVPFDTGMATIEKAVQDQFAYNWTHKGNQRSTPLEACSGTFWWRNNPAPCLTGVLPPR